MALIARRAAAPVTVIFRSIYCISGGAFQNRQKSNVNGWAESQLYFSTSRTLQSVLRKLDGSCGNRWRMRKTGMDLLYMLLDLADAISAGVAIAGFWYTWVVPADDRRPWPGAASGPDELERFIRAAALVRPPSRRLT